MAGGAARLVPRAGSARGEFAAGRRHPFARLCAAAARWRAVADLRGPDRAGPVVERPRHAAPRPHGDVRQSVRIDRRLFLGRPPARSEEHTSELQSLMRSSYAVFCLKKKTLKTNIIPCYEITQIN